LVVKKISAFTIELNLSIKMLIEIMKAVIGSKLMLLCIWWSY